MGREHTSNRTSSISVIVVGRERIELGRNSTSWDMGQERGHSSVLPIANSWSLPTQRADGRLQLRSKYQLAASTFPLNTVNSVIYDIREGNRERKMCAAFPKSSRIIRRIRCNEESKTAVTL